MRKLVENDIVLELCPTSNLRTHAVEDLEAFAGVIERFRDAGVRFTINTDGPYLLGTTLRDEFDLLLRHGIVSGAEIRSSLETARAASFIA